MVDSSPTTNPIEKAPTKPVTTTTDNKDLSEVAEVPKDGPGSPEVTKTKEVAEEVEEEDPNIMDSLAVDSQDNFSITSDSPELGPSDDLAPVDELDPDIALLYNSESASDFASASVAAMDRQQFFTPSEEPTENPIDTKPQQTNPRVTLDKVDTSHGSLTDSAQNSIEPKIISPRSPGVHPLSRETTSLNNHNNTSVGKGNATQSGSNSTTPVIQVNGEPEYPLQDQQLNKPGEGKRDKNVKFQQKNGKPDDNSGTDANPSSSAFMLRNLGAHDWTTSAIKIDYENGTFCDSYGRVLNFRGVNVAGCSKTPISTSGQDTVRYPDPAFYDHRNVSFIGRPFPLDDAPDHFRRLRAWGLTVLRFLVPWEAIEHEAPGVYDEEYITYLIKLFDVAHEYGFKIVIDPHQDTWSRFSGGSGAPGWTFEVVGLDLTQFDETGAAHIEGMPLIHPSHVPLWSTNNSKLAACTMFTIFFGGDEFAPGRTYEGVSAQTFLQQHYIQSYRHLASKLRDSPAVIGFEAMNEPSPGYIGLKNLDQFDQNKDLHLGLMPSPLQGMALGDGLMLKVPCYNKSWPWPSKSAGLQLANPNGARAWLSFTNCVWREQGVWDVQAGSGAPMAIKPDYFSKRVDGYLYDFDSDFYLPFIKKFSDAIQSVHENLIIFLAPVPNQPPPKTTPAEIKNMAYAPHWYDLRSIFTKSFDGRITYDVLSLARGSRNLFAHTYFGSGGTRKCYTKQVKMIKDWGKEYLGKVPIWIGELGIPFDINNKSAFETKDYTLHDQFMDAVLNAVDENFAGVAIWNYNPLNTNASGDDWNQEDFSIYSQDRPTITDKSKEVDNPIHRGGRCTNAVARPYASKVAGQPLHTSFDLATLEFHLEFASVSKSRTRPDGTDYTAEESRMMRQTEIFLPSFHYKRQKLIVHLSDGAWRYVPELQTLYYWYGDDRKVEPVAPITDYEDDGMESESDSDDGYPAEEPEKPSATTPKKPSGAKKFFSRIRKEFEVNQVDDDDEPEYDPSLIPVNGMIHKIRILVKEYVENDSW